ncbi:hypothetical protein SZN_37883 [Streptomyces zinciresistens K42]|uniref:DUF202 domain-containing protein n=1 Tax=Streptomyces zinciresistens K42 TaxID=700597 RepID=G2GPW2_9ACTN|nr:DUF202 domain-containing protein [Streptomyces zinciresistens]EGX54454.1 hypothetical protein SZN_37883 [Streptomyces zinciresistens K42]
MSTGAAPEPVRDPGLQPERTLLAWRRTTLTGTVTALLAMKTALHGGASAPGLLAFAVCFALWLAFLGLAHRRVRALAASAAPAPLAPRHAVATVLVTTALAVFASALIF